jgi:hypothetical protein
MNRDGARNAKAEAFEEAFGFREVASATGLDAEAGPTFAPFEGTTAYREIARGRKERKPDARELVALGVLRPSGHNRNPDDLRLGIFIQQKRLLQHPVVEDVQRISRGDCKVIVTGPAERRAAANPGRCRPLRIGASIGHHRVSAGTLACFATKRDGGGFGLLSNNHILADTNQGKPGDRIIQPARSDGGRGKNADAHVATLHKFVPINFDSGSINFVDCAFAHVLDEVEGEASIVTDPEDSSNFWKVGPIEPLVNDLLPVRKVGRTTAYTEGFVEAVEIDNLSINMRPGSHPKMARFDKQIAISGNKRAFSKPGDSGSMVFTEDGRPVALIFAGTERGGAGNLGITYANPISLVLDMLNVDIYTR